jgi:HK97 family phage major capsid protein/HK97 family phage prohead protease
MNRAYSLLEIKGTDERARIFTGIATTSSTDLMEDVVESEGAQFRLPIPLLWQHDKSQPIGHVTEAKVTPKGILITAQLASVPEEGALKNRLDDAWQTIKYGLVRGLSIGFKPIETARIEGTHGIRFLKWLWLELSAVTVAANSECSVQQIRSLDHAVLAASGQEHAVSEASTPAGVSATKPVTVVTTKDFKPMAKTISEQIVAFEATRSSKAARMTEIMTVAGEKGETLDAAATEEYDTLKVEVKAVDDHLTRLRDHEKTNVARAVDVSGATDTKQASDARGGSVAATVRANKQVPAGMGFTRYCLALARGKGSRSEALEIAKHNEQWAVETPDVEMVLRSAVIAGTTTDATWAGPLVQYQNLVSEFISYLRPLTIIGRIPGLRYVPFKVKIPRQTGTSTANWVGEGQAKPVSALSFDSVTLDIATISDIVIFTQQLARHSSPAAEMIIRDDLAAKIVSFMDAQFVDPTVAATGSNPASITNGVTPTVATGTTGDALRTDIGQLIEVFLEANMQLNSPVWLMSQVTAARINLIRNALGQKEYPELNVNGGTFEGFPVVTSQSIPATGGSPTDGYPIILMNAGDILIADDGQVRIDASSEASLQMDTAPDSPTTGSTTLISLWQQGLMGVKADRDINWVKRRSTAVGFISSAKYVT